MPSRLDYARALKACLTQLGTEAMDHGLNFCALHLNVAVLELDDLIETEQMRERLLTVADNRPHPN